MSEAIGLFLTFSTYRTHLHGAESGSVNKHNRSFGSPTLEPDCWLISQARNLMPEPPFYLDDEDRQAVLSSIQHAPVTVGGAFFARM
jgi:hypothetical protein